MDNQLLLYILGGLLITIGFAGLILPALPGVPLLFGGMVIVAWADDFTLIGYGMLTALLLLTILSVILDFAAGVIGAQRVGASKFALIGAMIGTIVGIFFGIPGLIFGPFIGAIIGEWIHSRETHLATKVGIGTWIGLLVGTVAKISIAFLMLGLFVFALIF